MLRNSCRQPISTRAGETPRGTSSRVCVYAEARQVLLPTLSLGTRLSRPSAGLVALAKVCVGSEPGLVPEDSGSLLRTSCPAAVRFGRVADAGVRRRAGGTTPNLHPGYASAAATIQPCQSPRPSSPERIMKLLEMRLQGVHIIVRERVVCHNIRSISYKCQRPHPE